MSHAAHKGNAVPLTPIEVRAKHVESIPGFVIEAFNQLLVNKSKVNSKSTTITQDEAMELVLKLAPIGTSRSDIFEKGWMDIEPIFKAYGWTVEYDKPAYCETYKAHYIFSFN